jgi:hypothetical protein
LILPWFLIDIINAVNAVNTYESVSDSLNTIRSGF